MSLLELKQSIEQETSTPSSLQRLILSGREITHRESATLGEVGITSSCMITMIARGSPFTHSTLTLRQSFTPTNCQRTHWPSHTFLTVSQTRMTRFANTNDIKHSSKLKVCLVVEESLSFRPSNPLIET